MCLGWIVLAFVLGLLCCAGSLLVLGYYFPPGATGRR